MHVLIIDDDEIDQMFIKSLVEKCGAASLQAGSGEQALALCKEHEPGLAFLDWSISGTDTEDLLVKLLKTKPDLKVVMVTGIEDQRVIDKCKALGAADFLSKDDVSLETVGSFIK